MSAFGLTKEYLFAPKMWALYDQMVVSAANFLVLLMLARKVGAKAFGVFALAYAVCLFLNGLHRAFITQPFNVIAATESEADRALRLGALVLALFVWIPAECIGLALAGLFFYPDPYLIAAACFHLAASQTQDLLRRSWFTTGEIRKAFWNDLVSYGGQIIAFAVLNASSMLDPVTAFLALGATSMIAAIAAPMQGLQVNLRAAGALRSHIAQHWAFGRWLVFGAFASWGAGQLYPFMLNVTAGGIAVGALLASRNLLNATGVLVQSINSYLPSRAKVIFEAQGIPGLEKYLRYANQRMVLLGCGFCLLVALAAPQILNVLYGTSYAHAEQALRILCVGTLFSVFTIIPGVGLMALGRTRTIFVSNVIGTGFALTGGWYLVSRAGLDGAAVSIATGLGLAFAIQRFALHREYAHGSRVHRD